MSFSLEAFQKTKGQCAERSAITPKKFRIGTKVKIKNGVNIFSVIGFKWLGNRWFYEILPGVYTNGDYLQEV